jgi:hypothetical protein
VPVRPTAGTEAPASLECAHDQNYVINTEEYGFNCMAESTTTCTGKEGSSRGRWGESYFFLGEQRHAAGCPCKPCKSYLQSHSLTLTFAPNPSLSFNAGLPGVSSSLQSNSSELGSSTLRLPFPLH